VTEQDENRPQETAREALHQVEELLHKHQLVEALVHRQDMPRHELVESLVHKQNLAELQKRLDQMHPADVAYILESLPPEERLLVWDLVKAERDGEILLEVSDAVRESLISDMENHELVAAAKTLDSDEIADLAPDLPEDVIQELLVTLDAQKRARLQSALAYEEDTVGGLMDFDMVTIRPDVTLETALRYLRRLGDLPDQCDKLFVTDRSNLVLGVLPLQTMLVHDPEVMVAAVMSDGAVSFLPTEGAAIAAQAFERYDLVSAPVVDDEGRLIGRITVDAVVDFIRQESDADILSLAGLREGEDLFSTVWKAAKNRWLWLAINLFTAFIASRVISVFEGSIAKLAALAALMPIVAGVGGNSGYQTTTLIIRGLALNQITAENARWLILKEVGVALLNGLVWGTAVGLFAWGLYDSPPLGFVMMAAMQLNLLVAALVGIFVPLALQKAGRDPAFGSGVLLTATTDSMGFFIFLGLATVFIL
jgi:magnesium transporter